MKKLLILIVILAMAACGKKKAGPIAVVNDTVTQQKTPATQHETGQRIGAILGKNIAFDRYYPNAFTTSDFVVYIENGPVKDTLFSLKDMDDFGDFYISGAEVLTLQDKPFIYVSSAHTYGHSKGYLFSVNINKKKAWPVKVLPDTYKIPDSLYSGHVTHAELEKDKDNNFSFGVNLHSPNADYTYSGKYRLVDKGNEQYVLSPYDKILSSDNGNVYTIK